MFPNPCEEFFREHAENREKVKALQKIADAPAWQALSASRHSPSVVADEEIICRQVPDPTFVDAGTGEIKPALFDDINNKGMSVDRLAHSPLEQIAERARARFKPQGRSLHSVVHLSTNAVRRLLSINGIEALGVYDTALADNISHADVCFILDNKQAFRSARESLFQLSKDAGAVHRFPPTQAPVAD